jgi:hypothetical protein
MDSEEAAARLDLMELLAGEGAVLSSLQEAKVEQGERARSPSPHVRLRAADLCTSHRSEPQVEVDLLSPFDGLPLQRRDQPLRQVSVCGCLA